MKPPSEAKVAAFDQFWGAYPYRQENPKAPARAVFMKLLESGEDAEALIAAASRYAAFCKAEKIKSTFIPHARKWLHLRYFEDYMTNPDAPVSALAGPSPEHPLAALYADVGEGPWLSYFAPLTVDTSTMPARVTAATRYALDRLQRDYARQIEAVLGAVTWEIRS